jgi:hypothetical protein
LSAQRVKTTIMDTTLLLFAHALSAELVVSDERGHPDWDRLRIRSVMTRPLRIAEAAHLPQRSARVWPKAVAYSSSSPRSRTRYRSIWRTMVAARGRSCSAGTPARRSHKRSAIAGACSSSGRSRSEDCSQSHGRHGRSGSGRCRTYARKTSTGLVMVRVFARPSIDSAGRVGRAPVR